MSLAKKKCLLTSAIVVIIGVALAGFLAFGPPRLFAKSESPEFCGSCHVLAPEYESWFHSGAHQNIKCVDCHLPNGSLAGHLAWKTLDGVKDFLRFHTGLVSDPIRLSHHGAGVVVANCRRCHTEILSRLNEERQCWDCHRRLTHKRTGTIDTRTP
jgi:cytochrome c nitrite reductase small subunit